MSSTDQIKPAGKSGKRKRKGAAAKKADAVETQAPVQLQSPEPQPEPSEPVPAEIAPVVQLAAEAATVAEVAPEPTVTTQPVDVAPVEVLPPAASVPVASVPTESASVSLQTIANAYRDYTRKSFEQFGSYFEQLSGVRSLDKAMTVQTEFMKRAYETSVSESQKICELHSRLARQTFQPFRGLIGKAPEAGGKS
jgi:hypothetical protein